MEALTPSPSPERRGGFSPLIIIIPS
ncbi:MAG: hypothetical protein ACD_2C00071G0001, partial [uncultured bacterium (gcode 4)]